MNKAVKTGRYIIIESLDDQLSLDQVDKLSHKIEAAGFPVKKLKSPDNENNLISREIGQILTNRYYQLPQKTKLLIELANHHQINHIISQFIDQGYYCISHKSFLSLLIDFFYTNKQIFDLNLLNNVINNLNFQFKPDMMIFIDTPATFMKEQAAKFDTKIDIELIEKKRTGYLVEGKKRQVQTIHIQDNLNSLDQKIWQIIVPIMDVKYQAPDYFIFQPTSSQISTITTEEKKDREVRPPEPVKPEIKFIEFQNHFQYYIQTDSDHQDQLLNFINQELKISLTKESLVRLYPYHLDDILVNTKQLSFLTSLDLINGVPFLIDQSLKTYTLEENNYFIPHKITETTKRTYKQYLDKILANYNKLLLKTDQHQSSLNILPLAIYKPSLIMFNRATLKKQFLENGLKTRQELDKVNPFLNDLYLDQFKQPISVASLKKIQTNQKEIKVFQENNLKQTYSQAEPTHVKLLNFTPVNELDLVSDIIYELNDLNKAQILKITDEWNYDQKTYLMKNIESNNLTYDWLKKYANYQIEIIDSIETFMKVKEMWSYLDLKHQPFSPRLGFNTPDLIAENEEFLSIYEENFQLSLELYSFLTSKKLYDIADYSLLLGHKIRFKLYLNLQQIISIKKTIAQLNDNNLTKLFDQILNQITQVHPIIINRLIQ